MNRILSCCVSRTYFSYIMLHYKFFMYGYLCNRCILFSFSIKIKKVSVIDWKEIQSRSIFPQKWQSRLKYSIQNDLLYESPSYIPIANIHWVWHTVPSIRCWFRQTPDILHLALSCFLVSMSNADAVSLRYN